MIFSVGDPELNLHLPLLLGGGTTQTITIPELKYSIPKNKTLNLKNGNCAIFYPLQHVRNYVYLIYISPKTITQKTPLPSSPLKKKKRFHPAVSPAEILPAPWHVLTISHCRFRIQSPTPLPPNDRCSTSARPAVFLISWLHWLCLVRSFKNPNGLGMVQKSPGDVLGIIQNYRTSGWMILSHGD